MFLEYYGDSVVTDILFTIGTKEDYDAIINKYKHNHNSEELKQICMNPGDYRKKHSVENCDEINSYYCSLEECGIVFKFSNNNFNENNNFLYLISMKIKNKIEKRLNNFNLSTNFEFPDPTEYD